MDGLYHFSFDDGFSRCLFHVKHIVGKHSAHNEKLAFLWHKRLDHISKERAMRLVKSETLSHLDFVDQNLCVDCIKGMQTSHS
jgi:hypothetical protein